MQPVRGSFRDPCGRVFTDNGKIFRTIDVLYKAEWEQAVSSGLHAELMTNGQMLPYEEVQALFGAWKVLQVEAIPFISYPYEWSFHQLRDAALLTLDIQRAALRHGMILKDASAYNIQFKNGHPVFIDLLSFETWRQNTPWEAYRQFCMHFLGALALHADDSRLGRLASLWIDGIPLEVSWNLLGWKKYLSMGLQMHLNLHSKAERKYQDARAAADKIKKVKISSQGLLDLTDSLYRTVQSIKLPKTAGEWTDYYQDTNYSFTAKDDKAEFVRRCAHEYPGKIALDLGANTGTYSAIISPFFASVVAADLDPLAVDAHYQNLQRHNTNILPLVMDLGNPSPCIGWANSERDSWMQRQHADFVCALALTHHLYFGNGIPWREQAEFFSAQLRTGGALVTEFVPIDDSQVKRMLAARNQTFLDYSLKAFKTIFAELFQLHTEKNLPDSGRVMLLMTKK